jgi:tRNA (guanine-N7-)-methyltransferase
MAFALALALQEYRVDWRAAAWPLDWAAVFGREAPLALEIGFGNGSFLAEQARARPERDHVGIELSWTSATHLFRRLQRERRSNARALIGEAETLVRHLFAPGALDEVCVNHPCPWPKARHAERRLLRREVLALLAERMRPGARLTVVTDHAGYATWLGGELAAQALLESCHPSVEVPALPGRSATRYQEKAMARGVPIHYFEWRRKGAASDVRVVRAPASQSEMPTLTLEGEVETAELFRGFRPALFRERLGAIEVAVKLEAVYRRADAEVFLLEAFVQEDRLRQRFGIDVVPRPSGILLKLAELGRPHPTHGVKRAVWCAARWLQARHPRLVVRAESLALSTPAEPWPPAPR